MTRAFISYCHEDRIQVAHIVEHLRASSVDLHLDRVDLRSDDFIGEKLRDQLRAADFVCLVLSENSAGSEWVRQEVAEMLAQELAAKRARLLPCILASCRLPAPLDRLVRLDRLHVDFREDFGAGLFALTERISLGSRPIFQQEQYLYLDIPVPDLQIYLTGELWNWQRNDDLRYLETIDGYVLLGFRMEPWSYFRHFALCEETDAPATRSALQSAGMIVTGTGDRDRQLGKRRVWFTLPDYPIDGSQGNNRWPEDS